MNKKHVFFYKLVRPIIVVFLWLKFGYTFTVARNLPENYIVLSNHTTDYDPLFLGASFPRQMYFVGSEPAWLADTRQTLYDELTRAIMTDAVDKYELTIDYNDVMIGFVDMNTAE